MVKKHYKVLILMTIAFSILTASFIIMSLNTSSFNKVNAEPIDNSDDLINEDGTGVDDTQGTIEEEKPLESLTGLFIGFDSSEGLTDVIMVAYLDTEVNEVKVISVPRDLLIDFRTDEFKQIKENNDNNHLIYCKLNEVYSNTGWNDEALMDVREIVSIITGLEIDYMATVDVNGFADIVDVVGGVEFYVPQRMYYNDPVQDLYIDLYEGLQVLDGNQAEQLVRYRKYVMGDLQRIQVQQDFMLAMIKKIMEIEDFGTITQLASAVYDITEHDFGLMEALKYAEYYYDLDFSEVFDSENMVTIPSYGEKIDEIWYQRWMKDETEEMLDELFSDNE
jgi:LCP family protein required for cell wall assembly